MEDGTTVVTEVVRENTRRMNQCLDLILRHMVEHEDMVVCLDMAWSKYSLDHQVLLALCTQIGCALVRIYRGSFFEFQKQFFDNKDITFVGFQIKEDVRKMRELLGLEIRNAVDLSELTDDVLHEPRLRAVGLRRLASEDLLVPFKTRSSRMAQVNGMAPEDLKTDQTECVTTDAYAA